MSEKICRQPECSHIVDRPDKRADCDMCFNRLRRERYASDAEFREETKARNVQRNSTREGKASRIWSDARLRAIKKNLNFNLDKEDVVIPDTCPYLHIPLVLTHSEKQDDSPSLDRIDPKRGYVKGNVEVISEKANRIKNDANFQEILLIATRLEYLLSEH